VARAKVEAEVAAVAAMATAGVARRVGVQGMVIKTHPSP